MEGKSTIKFEVTEPERVEVYEKDGIYCICSAQNTNDTVEWFEINSPSIEDVLLKAGLSWCYVFVTKASEKPMIYMFYSEGLTKEILINAKRELFDTIPENIHIYIEEGRSFSSIDVDQYDNTISEFERELLRKCSDVLKVF